MINSGKDEELIVPNEERNGPGGAAGDPYDEDMFQPYNLTAEKLGAFNEWRDKKYEWDTLVDRLNTKLFKNESFKEC